jgi:hypothetical protein
MKGPVRTGYRIALLVRMTRRDQVFADAENHVAE